MISGKQKDLTVELYTPHPGQLRMHNRPERFRVGCWGRRAGKTFGCCNDFTKKLIERRRTLNWWVAPTYRQSEIAFEIITKATRDLLVKKPNYTKLRLDYLNGSVAEFRSAEKYDNLRGDGIHNLVMDECRDIASKAWQEVLMPTLADTDGTAMFISTPRGRDWFHDLYMLGQDPLEKDYWSFSAPSMINPYLDLAFIEEMRRKLPADVFRQEILAVFLEDAATVFKRVDSCIDGELEEPKAGHTYVIGWDPAKHTDFSVVIILDCNTGHMVGFDRDNQTDYRIQLLRVIALAYKYNQASVCMDATGVGDPLLERLQEAGLTCEGYVFTNASKKEMVERLQLAIEHRQITYPNIEIMINELKEFGYKITASRNIVYSAPDGKHDDTVSALGLAVYAANIGNEIALVRSRGSSGMIIPESREFNDPELDGHMSQDQKELIDRRQRATGNAIREIMGMLGGGSRW